MRAFLFLGASLLAVGGAFAAGPVGDGVVDPSNLTAPLTYDHNGSSMIVSFEDGLVVYREPRAAAADMVVEGQVLFRGTMRAKGRIAGTAYAFKRGCTPAPYAVQGHDSGVGFVLTGKAPIRGAGCEVIGHSSNSPASFLWFGNPLSL